MFSQRDEETHILKYFRKRPVGKFLDIGAYDGKTFSTTRALALKGWRGVCVEPALSVFPVLQKLYLNNSNVETLEYAISNTTGMITFYDSGGDMVSSINKKHVKLWEDKGGCTFKKTRVSSLTVLDLFKRVGYDFDFINLDVEGTNLDILQQFPFSELKKMKMLCVEFDNQKEKVMRLVQPYKFRLYHKTAENLLLVR